MTDSTAAVESKPVATLVKWITRTHYENIQRVECTRETDKSVWVLENHEWDKRKPPRWAERRRDRVSNYDRFHDTWEEAHAHLLQRAEDKLAEARRALQLAQATHGNIKGMKKPEGA